MCVSIWRAVSVAVGDLDPFGPKFSVGLFDCWAAHPYNQIKMESKMIGYLFIKFLKNIFIAPWKLAVVKARLSASDKTWLYSIPYISFFVAFILLEFMELSYNGCWAIGVFFYLCFVTCLAAVRVQCRQRFGINGNPFEDFFAALFLYPNVILQLEMETKTLEIVTVETLVTLVSNKLNGHM